MKNNVCRILLFAALTILFVNVKAEGWNRLSAPVMTEWGEKIEPENVWGEYPRPQMERAEWMSLNGVWEYCKQPTTSMAYVNLPELNFTQKILVPFPIESALSGIMDKDYEGNVNKTFCYRRTFVLPDSYRGKRILLHFGAVDWKCTVYVNGRSVGVHAGGNDPFSFDITDFLVGKGEQEIQVAVIDPTDRGGQPCGKQAVNPGGIFYSPVSGIWQTVWIEPVHEAHVDKYEVISDIDRGIVTLRVVSPVASALAQVTVKDGDKVVAVLSDVPVNTDKTVVIPSPRLWSPDAPFLYDLLIDLYEKGKKVDAVQGYFGMRKIGRAMLDGRPCLMLNNRPLFHYGVLDQGWWPDGLLTPPSDEAMRYDVDVAKSFGMNMIRKHVKVEPARWYYYCDKVGMLVWQDMPNGKDAGMIGDKDDIRQNFYEECTHIVDVLKQHPCIVSWVVYNEGWGQDAGADDMHTRRGVETVLRCDDTRLVNPASGWTNFEMGDINDCHSYPSPALHTNPLNERVAVCGEYGGITLKVDGHIWKGSGMEYVSVNDNKELAKCFNELTLSVQELQKEGIWGAVYTQMTDVEEELNGLLTYDRKVLKVTGSQRESMRDGIQRTIRYRRQDAGAYVPVDQFDTTPLVVRHDEPVVVPGDSVYLMSYFKSNGQHLYYAYSRDGKKWTDINAGRPVFSAYDNSVCLRDPYMRRVTRNGVAKYHLVHTWGWDHPAIFHWESTDLVHWTAANGGKNTEDGKVMLMDGKDGRPSSPCAWAPEFTYDEATDTYYIYWASRFDGKLVHYYCTTRDWREFSIPEVYFDPGFTAIDMSILKYEGTYYAFYKDERDGKKTILCATSKSLNPKVQPFEGTTPILPSRYIEVEGPEIFPAIGGKGWFLYFDKFNRDRGCSFTACTDPAGMKWYPMADEEIVNPKDVKHGSVEIISRDELQLLLDKYDYERMELMPTAETVPQEWKYAFSFPGEGWQDLDFDDSSWKSGKGGFGAGDVPGGMITTEWSGSDIYLRKTFTWTLSSDAEVEYLTARIHHDEDAKVYLNGVLAFAVKGYTTGYDTVEFSDAAKAAVNRSGENTIAIHCHQSTGGQYIDLGLETLKKAGTHVPLAAIKE